MSRSVTGVAGIAGALFGLLLTACSGDDANDKISGSIHVAPGTPAADYNTVNGSILVAENATAGRLNVVNGDVRLGAHATAAALHTVNGAITLDAGAHAAEAITVNGPVTLSAGAQLDQSLTNVAGKITLTDAHVGGTVTTVAGNIDVAGASQIDGGILVQKPSGLMASADVPVIVIGPNASVKGALRFERDVKLYVSGKASIGPVTGATAVPFSGDKPPI